MKLKSLIIVVPFLLMGCASSRVQLIQQTAPNDLAQPCPPIVMISEVKTLGELVEFTVDVINQYGDCRSRHEGLSKWQK